MKTRLTYLFLGVIIGLSVSAYSVNAIYGDPNEEFLQGWEEGSRWGKCLLYQYQIGTWNNFKESFGKHPVTEKIISETTIKFACYDCKYRLHKKYVDDLMKFKSTKDWTDCGKDY